MFGKVEKETERKVFIFTVLLVIAMFVTVALYVYAGKQQNLPTRELGAVNVKKTLGVGGKFYQSTDVIPINDGDTMDNFDGGNKIYRINPSADATVTLPRLTELDELKQFKQGRALEFYLLNESSSRTVTLAINADDSSRVSEVYTSAARNQGLTTIIIRKNSEDEYRVIIG